MSLKDTLDEMSWRKTSVYNRATGCQMDRNGDGEIILTMDAGRYSVTHTLIDLIRGPGNGLRGASLETAIRIFMEAALSGEEKYAPATEEDM